MRKEFATNLGLLLAINLLVKPLYLFGIDMGVQNAVGTEQYGQYAFAFSFTFLFGMLYDLGLQNYNSVSLSKNPGLLSARLPALLSLKLGLSVVFAGVVLATAYSLGMRGKLLQLVALAALYHVTLSFLQLLRTNLSAQGKYQFNSWVSVIDKVLLIIGLGLVLLSPEGKSWITVEYFFLAQTAALGIAIVVVVVGTDHERMERWLSWDKATIMELIKASLPFGLILLMSSLSTRIDVVMLERLHPAGDYEAGKYAGAYRLLDAYNMVGFMFASLLLPMLSKLVEEGKPAAQLIRQGAGYMLALAVGAAAWVTFYATDITALLYTEATRAWGECLRWLIWAAVGVGLTYIYGSYLLARQSLRDLNIIFAVAIVLNVALNLVLIDTYGATGTAVATVVSGAFVVVSEWVLTQRALRAEGPPAYRWWPLPVYVLGVLATAYASFSLGLGLWPSLVVQLFVCAALGGLTGLLVPRDLWLRLQGRRKQSRASNGVD